LQHKESLVAFANDDVRHDLDMFLWLCRVLSADRRGGALRQFDPRLGQAMWTATLVHLNSLLKFLYQDEGGTEPRAADYLAPGQWRSVRPAPTTLLLEAAKIAPNRDMDESVTEELDLEKLVEDLRLVLTALLGALPDDLAVPELAALLEE